MANKYSKLSREELRERLEWSDALLYGNRSVVRGLDERIRKLYMGLNADARGEETDFDGEPTKIWNRLVCATAQAFAYAIAQGRWAVVLERAIQEHHEAQSATGESDSDADRKLWEMLKGTEETTVEEAKEIDTANDFLLGSNGDTLQFMISPQQPGGLDKAKALRLAAWLVVLADPLEEEFPKVLEAIKNT